MVEPLSEDVELQDQLWSRLHEALEESQQGSVSVLVDHEQIVVDLLGPGLFQPDRGQMPLLLALLLTLLSRSALQSVHQQVQIPTCVMIKQSLMKCGA